MKFIRPFFVIAVAVITLISLYNYYFNDRFAKGGWDKVVKYLKDSFEYGDAIFFPSFIPVPFAYYFKGEIPIEVINKFNCLQKVSLYKRIFLISYLEKFSDSEKEVYNLLNHAASKIDERRYADITIYNFLNLKK